MNIDLPRLLMTLFAFMISVTFHEFGHAIAALSLGDDGPKRAGRVTLNPLDHLDVLGTLFLLITSMSGIGFGWGRPVMTNPKLYKNPKSGDIIVSLAGPSMNLLLAIVLAIIIRTGSFHLSPASPYFTLIGVAFDLNVLLFLFNLIPLPPLDGSHILADLLPENMAKSYMAAMASYGFLLFVVFILFGGALIQPVMSTLERILVG